MRKKTHEDQFSSFPNAPTRRAFKSHAASIGGGRGEGERILANASDF